ncbi:MAG: phosphatidylserine/phosphatidylglycerophosphate/cardiolipin synthase family protein [Oligoflexia bacterium]|nr:phosphatidylserine/phosphatidylglycerophosphate/cardiolipin synthase family protein [Oligoflexia bacterium]
MREMIDAGVKVYAHTPDLKKDEPNYVHRKLVVTGNTVFFGSHNLSVPSSVITEEVSVEIVGPSLAKQVRDIFDDNIKTTGKEVTSDQVQSASGILGSSKQLIQDSIGNVIKPLY